MTDFTLGPGPLQVDYEKLKADIGIVENTDVAVHAITEGMYVIWKERLYVANTDISIGTALNSSNLTAKTNGIGGELASLMIPEKLDIIVSSSTTILQNECYKIGKIVIINLRLTTSAVTNSGSFLFYGLPKIKTAAPNGTSMGPCTCKGPNGSMMALGLANDSYGRGGAIRSESFPEGQYFINASYVTV